MNLYDRLGSGAGTTEAASLCARLAAWHDAMVVHERRLKTGSTSDGCDEECPHAEAPALWTEALAAFGSQARELTFLRSQAEAAVDDTLADSFPASDPPSWNSGVARAAARAQDGGSAGT